MSVDWTQTGFIEVWEIVPGRFYEVSTRDLRTYRIFIGETMSGATIQWQPTYDVLVDEGFDSAASRTRLVWQRLVGVAATLAANTAEQCLQQAVYWLEDHLGTKQIGRG